MNGVDAQVCKTGWCEKEAIHIPFHPGCTETFIRRLRTSTLKRLFPPRQRPLRLELLHHPL